MKRRRGELGIGVNGEIRRIKESREPRCARSVGKSRKKSEKANQLEDIRSAIAGLASSRTNETSLTTVLIIGQPGTENNDRSRVVQRFALTSASPRTSRGRFTPLAGNSSGRAGA